MEIESDVSRDHSPRYAFIGVRSCDLCAIDVQERVFKNEQFSDSTYLTRQKNVFIVAVNCTQSSGTCFCVSMNAGPKATGKFDLALTEVIGERAHYFVVQVGSDEGAEVMKDVPHAKAEASETAEAEKLVELASQNMGRTMKTEDLRELLFNNLESAHWDNVARRCLMCANCTMVCPTCFCSTVEDVTDLSGDLAIGHNRYSTSGTSTLANAQPVMLGDGSATLALCHNGNLLNAVELAPNFPAGTSDTRLLGHVLGSLPAGDGWLTRMITALAGVQGAYSMLLLRGRAL